MRRTKAMLEDENEMLHLENLRLNRLIANQACEIDKLKELIKWNPPAGIYMSMMNNTKAMRKSVEHLTEFLSRGK